MTQILIIDDEAVIRSALTRLLNRHNYDVEAVGSVKEAEAGHDIAAFDLIISDLRLPGAAGTEIIKTAIGTPVLIMTSYASVKSAVESMRLGAVDYSPDVDEYLEREPVHELAVSLFGLS